MFSSLNNLFASSNPKRIKLDHTMQQQQQRDEEEENTQEDEAMEEEEEEKQFYVMEIEFDQTLKTFVKAPFCFKLYSSLPLPNLYNFKKVYEVPDHIFFSLTFSGDNKHELYEDTLLILEDHFQMRLLPYLPNESQLGSSGAYIYDTHVIFVQRAKVKKIQFSIHNINVNNVLQPQWRPFINWFDGPLRRKFGSMRIHPIKPYVNIEEFNSIAYENTEIAQRTPLWYSRRSRNGLDNRYDKKATLRNKKVGVLCELEALYIFMYNKTSLQFEEAGYKNKCSPDGFIINKRRGGKRSALEIKCTANCDVLSSTRRNPSKIVIQYVRQSTVEQCLRHCISRDLHSFYLVKLYIDNAYFSASGEKLKKMRRPILACHCWYVELEKQSYWAKLKKDTNVFSLYAGELTANLNRMASNHDVGNHHSLTWEMLNVPLDELVEQIRNFRTKNNF